jgi:hypothetical protein
MDVFALDELPKLKVAHNNMKQRTLPVCAHYRCLLHYAITPPTIRALVEMDVTVPVVNTLLHTFSSRPSLRAKLPASSCVHPLLAQKSSIPALY